MFGQDYPALPPAGLDDVQMFGPDADGGGPSTRRLRALDDVCLRTADETGKEQVVGMLVELQRR